MTVSCAGNFTFMALIRVILQLLLWNKTIIFDGFLPANVKKKNSDKFLKLYGKIAAYRNL